MHQSSGLSHQSLSHQFSPSSEMSWSMTKPMKTPSEDSDQPRHLLSLIKVVAVHSMGSKNSKFLYADSKD